MKLPVGVHYIVKSIHVGWMELLAGETQIEFVPHGSKHAYIFTTEFKAPFRGGLLDKPTGAKLHEIKYCIMVTFDDRVVSHEYMHTFKKPHVVTLVDGLMSSVTQYPELLFKSFPLSQVMPGETGLPDIKVAQFVA